MSASRSGRTARPHLHCPACLATQQTCAAIQCWCSGKPRAKPRQVQAHKVARAHLGRQLRSPRVEDLHHLRAVVVLQGKRCKQVSCLNMWYCNCGANRDWRPGERPGRSLRPPALLYHEPEHCLDSTPHTWYLM